jgi:hypothetical protein
MLSNLSAAITVAMLLAAPEEARSTCSSFKTEIGGRPVELAVPGGYVEICSRDAVLCRILTAGYPASVKTIGYFATPEEWSRYQADPDRAGGFTRYLIAQHAGGMSPNEFTGFREYVRSRQGKIPDSTELPAVLEKTGQANIGVFEDADDAIAFGAVMKVQSAASEPNAGPREETLLASTNLAFRTEQYVLSLYVYIDTKSEQRVEIVKDLTREWLQCLRSAD